MCLVCQLRCPACSIPFRGVCVVYLCLPSLKGAECKRKYNGSRCITPTEAVRIKRGCDSIACTMSVTQQLITQSRLLHVVRIMDIEEASEEAMTHQSYRARTFLRSIPGDITTAIPTAADGTNAQAASGAVPPEADTKHNLVLHQHARYRRRTTENFLRVKDRPRPYWDWNIRHALDLAWSPLSFPLDRLERDNPKRNPKRAAVTEPEYAWICAQESSGPQAGCGSTPASAGNGQASQDYTPDSTNFHHATPSNSSGQAPGPHVPAHSTISHPSASTTSAVPNQATLDHGLPRTDPQMSINDLASDRNGRIKWVEEMLADWDKQGAETYGELLPPLPQPAVSAQPHDNIIDPRAHGSPGNHSGTPAHPATEVSETPVSALLAQPQQMSGFPNQHQPQYTNTQPGVPAFQNQGPMHGFPAQNQFGHTNTQPGGTALPTQVPGNPGASPSNNFGSFPNNPNDGFDPFFGGNSWNAKPPT